MVLVACYCCTWSPPFCIPACWLSAGGSANHHVLTFELFRKGMCFRRQSLWLQSVSEMDKACGVCNEMVALGWKMRKALIFDSIGVAFYAFLQCFDFLFEPFYNGYCPSSKRFSVHLKSIYSNHMVQCHKLSTAGFTPSPFNFSRTV